MLEMFLNGIIFSWWLFLSVAFCFSRPFSLEIIPSICFSKCSCTHLFILLLSHFVVFAYLTFLLFLLDDCFSFCSALCVCYVCKTFSCRSGKRKALKLNFANPSIKPSTRFSLNTAGPPFQNPHMWASALRVLKTRLCWMLSDCCFTRERLRTHSIESSGKLKISPEQHWDFTAEDLKDLGEIGRGAYGSVNKMVHKPSNMIMAVKVSQRR